VQGTDAGGGGARRGERNHWRQKAQAGVGGWGVKLQGWQIEGGLARPARGCAGAAARPGHAPPGPPSRVRLVLGRFSAAAGAAAAPAAAAGRARRPHTSSFAIHLTSFRRVVCCCLAAASFWAAWGKREKSARRVGQGEGRGVKCHGLSGCAAASAGRPSHKRIQQRRTLSTPASPLSRGAHLCPQLRDLGLRPRHAAQVLQHARRRALRLAHRRLQPLQLGARRPGGRWRGWRGARARLSPGAARGAGARANWQLQGAAT
jgi:hypothetical protein